MSTVTRKVTTALATIIVAIATLVAPTTASAITGGTDAKVGTIADSTARVQIGNKSCTGTLIAPTWIITAKHCIGRGDYSFVSVGAPEHGETARVKDYIAHPDSDLLLVHTTKTMQSPVAPLATSYTTEGQAGYSMGWGSYREQNKTTIQQAEVEVQRQVTNVPGAINPADTFLEGNVYNGHLGQGDSGGPLFINGQLAGVASLANSGPADNRLTGALGWWVPVANHYDWITQHTGITTPTPAGTQAPLYDATVFSTIAPPEEVPASIQILEDLKTINTNTQELYQAVQDLPADGGPLTSLSAQLSS